jgi:hypothetical protein
MTWQGERAERMARYQAMLTVLNQRRKCSTRGCPFSRPCPDHEVPGRDDYADQNIAAMLDRLSPAPVPVTEK